MRRLATVFCLTAILYSNLACAQLGSRRSILRPEWQEEASTAALTLKSGTYAVFHTSDGEFIAQLFRKEAPKTTENFAALASGRKQWQHPVTRVDSEQPLYNNTQFYQIAADVVIRGGDPINKGTGGPGYVLDIEANNGLAFDKPGRIAMQNDGNKASGSRFFIALSPFPDWTNHYSVFGQVIGGMDVVRKISHKPTKRPFTPLEPTLINSVEIVEVPPRQQTTATFGEEYGNKTVTISQDFEASEAEPTPAAPLTTGTATTTTSATATTSTASGTTETATTASAAATTTAM